MPASRMARELTREWVELFSIQRKRVGWCLLKRLRREVTIRTRQGIFACKTSDTVIAPSLYIDGEFEYAFSLRCLGFLKQRGFLPCRERITLYDVGANIGIISIGLLRAGLVDQAVVFEPEPENCRLLRTNIARNGLDGRMDCVAAAVSDRSGPMAMEIAEGNLGDHRVKMSGSRVEPLMNEADRKILQVAAYSLDDFVRGGGGERRITEAPSLLWVDVQGHEGRVFSGGHSLLRGKVPVVAEIWPYGILRSGMSLEEFHDIVRGLWECFWVERKGNFVRYPVDFLSHFLQELVMTGGAENVIFPPKDPPHES